MRAVIFDLDGTLVNTVYAHAFAWYVDREDCYVIGDAVWDLLAARRASMLGVGLLTGGYGEQELAQAGAYRVYRDPAELLPSLYQLGLRAS